MLIESWKSQLPLHFTDVPHTICYIMTWISGKLTWQHVASRLCGIQLQFKHLYLLIWFIFMWILLKPFRCYNRYIRDMISLTPWLIMSWLLSTLGHHQLWYSAPIGLFNSARKVHNRHHFFINEIKYKDILVFYDINTARKIFKPWIDHAPALITLPSNL